MPIHIAKINAKNLGPIDSLDLTLGSLNLIYGQNETGKTYLVEFLLRSLFRDASKWDLRETPSKGSVSISGFSDKPIAFSLTSRKKIEDYWEDDELGLPLNMARLLVVKGGELDLKNVPGGVNRDVLKIALTSEELLDHIRKPISKTIQKAVINGQEINGDNRPPIKNLRDLGEEIQKLHFLLDRVENEYSQGPLRQLELNIKKIEIELEIQEKAKRYIATKMRQNINALTREKGLLSDEIIGNLRDDLHDYTEEESRLSEKEKDLETKQEDSKDYPWLESAISIWESRNLDVTKKPPRWLTISGMVLLLTGIILLGINDLISTLNLLWIGLPILTISAGMIFYSLIRLQQWTSSINETEERQSIKEEYKTRFGKTLRGLSVLKEKEKSIQRSYFQVEPLEKEIQEIRNIQNLRKSVLQELIETLTGKIIQEQKWEKTYQELKIKSTALTEKIYTLVLELEKLNVPEEEQDQENPTDEDYNSQQVIDLRAMLSTSKIDLEQLQNDLSSLKYVICHETGDDITSSWEEVLFNLRSINEEKETNYRELTARLVAEIGVIQILNRIEDEEDQKIQRDINTREVSDFLQGITGSYQSLELIDDQVYVSDKYSQYALRDLSTGAREQILLALRMGIAHRISGGKPLFLILDDAFQHSDWSRRESLVLQVINLVKKGWQVTYLSMDDHIRDLFLKHGKAAFKKQFMYYEIG